MLKIRDITKRFGGLVALKSLNMDINRGSISGLIGPNGSGKTTLFNVVTGFLRPNAGTIEFKKTDITGRRPHWIARQGIGRTFQLIKVFPHLTVLENAVVGAFSKTRNVQEAKRKASEVLDYVGLQQMKSISAANLTYVDRKKVELARALTLEPEIILIDELFGGLTPEEGKGAVKLVKGINADGVTIFLIEHVMRIVMSICDEITVIHHGEKIAEGTPKSVSKNKKVIEAYLGEKYVA